MKMRLYSVLWAAAVVCLIAFSWLGQAQADSLLYEYSLPTTNLNGPSGPNRSNSSPLPTYYSTQPPSNGYSIEGDRFTLGQSGQQFQLQSASLWMIWGSAGGHNDHTAIDTTNFPTNLSLWAGSGPGDIALRSSNPTITRVWYAEGENFQRGSDGAWRGLWRIDFQLNNALITGGQPIYYFLDGMFQNGQGQWGVPSLLAANVTNGDVTLVPSGTADDAFFMYDKNTGGISQINSYPYDVNVAIYGSEVPLPPSFLLLGSSLLGLVGWRRLRKG